MAAERDHSAPLPPPPPPPPAVPPTPTPLRPGGQTSPLRRIAVQPPLITTALAPPQGTSFLHIATPASATSLNVPFSPYAPSPSSYAATPVSSPIAMRGSSSVPYNPQQWGRNGPVGGAYLPHSASQTPTATHRPQDITGMEGEYPFFLIPLVTELVRRLDPLLCAFIGVCLLNSILM